VADQEHLRPFLLALFAFIVIPLVISPLNDVLNEDIGLSFGGAVLFLVRLLLLIPILPHLVPVARLTVQIVGHYLSPDKAGRGLGNEILGGTFHGPVLQGRDRDGPWTDAISRFATAIAAARHGGDRLGLASALNNLGSVLRMTDDFPAASSAHEEALGIYRDLGDNLGEADALHSASFSPPPPALMRKASPMLGKPSRMLSSQRSQTVPGCASGPADGWCTSAPPLSARW
jgi:Tetratricopeptide repeat